MEKIDSFKNAIAIKIDEFKMGFMTYEEFLAYVLDFSIDEYRKETGEKISFRISDYV